MKTLYGEFTENQMSQFKNMLHKEIFALLLMEDPKTKGDYLSFDRHLAFENTLTKINGMNLLLNEPIELVEVMCLLKMAEQELDAIENVTSHEFKHSKYRKRILDAMSEVEKIKEV